MLSLFRALPIVLFVATICAAGQEYAGPNALGPFRLDKDVTMRALFDRLGEPSSTTGDVFCFQSKDGKGFLVLTRMAEVYNTKVAGTVTLSGFRNCFNKTLTTTTVDLAAWKTSQGIGLGSTAEEVRKTFGKPSKEDKIEGRKYRWVIHGDRKNNHYTDERRPEIGDTVLVYQGSSEDLRIAEFGIREGKVVWISISKNE